MDRTENLKTMRKIPMKRRQTIKALAAGIKMPTTSTFHLLKQQVRQSCYGIPNKSYIQKGQIFKLKKLF